MWEEAGEGGIQEAGWGRAGMGEAERFLAYNGRRGQGAPVPSLAGSK